MKHVITRSGPAHAARALLVPFLGCALAACYFFPHEENVPAPPLAAPPPVTYDTVEVRPGPIVQSVIVPGTFVYADYAKLSFPSRGGWMKSVRVRIGDRVRAGDVIAELDTENLVNRIEQQKLFVRRAELSVERARVLEKGRIEIEMAQIDVELARLQLQDLQTQLAESRIVSPLNGVVVYLFATHGGVAVDAYRTIAQVADPARFLLIYKGDRAGEFRVGMKVTMTVGDDGFPGRIVMTPATTPPDAMADLQSAVLVEMSRLPPGVKEGDIAMITLEKARKEGVLAVPRDAVSTFEGRSFVQVLEGGIKKDRSVELGIETDTLTEILSGLSAGDKVVYQ
jgi:membrane fusion protein, macrolide-specific efflux system